MEIRLAFWHPTTKGQFNGRRPVLVAEGRKWLHVLCMDGHLTVRQLKLEELENMTPVLLDQKVETVVRRGKTKNVLVGGTPYPVDRAVDTFVAYGKTHGITKEARAFLSDALTGELA
jgi:hypothetical protein